MNCQPCNSCNSNYQCQQCNQCLPCSYCTQFTNFVCYAGNPNGNVAGTLGQVCFDTTTGNIYSCTTAGTALLAVWTLIGNECISSNQFCNQCNPIPLPPFPQCTPPISAPQGPLTPIIPIPITNFPQVSQLQTTAIIPCVQGGISSQCTVNQISLLARLLQILFYAGNPNGNLAGLLGQFCLDTVTNNLYICTLAGTATSTVWTFVGGLSNIVPPANGGTGVSSPTAHTIPIAEGASNFNFLTLTNGEILIGDTGNDPVPALITGSGGIIITPGPGTLNISQSGSGTASVDVTTATQAMMSNTTYGANYSGGNVTFTLPTSSVFGDVVRVIGIQQGWTIHQLTGQQIIIDDVSTTSGTGGSVTSTNAHDAIYLFCTANNATWTALSVLGNITYV